MYSIFLFGYGTVIPIVGYKTPGNKSLVGKMIAGISLL